VRPWIKYFLLGAVSFWGPLTVVAAVLHRLPGGKWQLVNLVVACLVSCITYLLLLRLRNPPALGTRIGLWMLIGMWVLSLWFELLSLTLQGGGFHGMKGSDWVYFLLFSLAPFPSLLFYAYDGSFFALLLVSLFLFVGDAALERRHSGTRVERNTT
jgi:hypothetical protein